MAERSVRGRLVARYLAAFAPLVVLIVGGIARRWMSDDGFINLRVARNLLSGHGPVFNAGERVEAVTSPLWIALLALVGATRVPLEGAAVAVGIVLGTAGALGAMRGALDVACAPRPLLRAPSTQLYAPLGALAFVALPPAWDFLSSGLENGLSYAWIGASFAAVAAQARAADDAPDAARPARTLVAIGALVGLGPLVRPDLALAAAAFGLVVLVVAQRGRTRRGGVATGLGVLASATVLPVAYQVFRMGYYGTTGPNTALAKEAFRANWNQGGTYLLNFLGTYLLLLPLAMVLLFVALTLRDLARDGRRMTTLLVVASLVGAVACALYVVRVGGDFMHARMLLPATFLFLAPTWLVPVRGPDRVSGDLRFVQAFALLITLAWSVPCAALFRVPDENQSGIGDERRWYAREAGVATPVTLEDYRRFSFYDEGATLRAVALGLCPHGTWPADRGRPQDPAACRRILYVDQSDYGHLYPDLQRYPLALQHVDPGVVMAAARVGIGIISAVTGPAVHLIDRAGLGDPIASRIELRERGRPGHEKTLSNVWLVARFGLPVADEDPRITVARRALACGALARLDAAVRAPMTAARFATNLRDAWELSRVRIPLDPWEAETRFCGTRQPTLVQHGGHGGEHFQLLCDPGAVVTSLRATVHDVVPRTLARLRPRCEQPGTPVRELSLGAPTTGADSVLACAPGESIVGLYGGAGDLVDRVGVLCAASPGDALAHHGAAVGSDSGTPWEQRCPTGQTLVGIGGHSGDLVDAIGPLCSGFRP